MTDNSEKKGKEDDTEVGTNASLGSICSGNTVHSQKLWIKKGALVPDLYLALADRVEPEPVPPERMRDAGLTNSLEPTGARKRCKAVSTATSETKSSIRSRLKSSQNMINLNLEIMNESSELFFKGSKDEKGCSKSFFLFPRIVVSRVSSSFVCVQFAFCPTIES